MCSSGTHNSSERANSYLQKIKHRSNRSLGVSMKVKVAQSCLPLWHHGRVHGVLQDRILDRVVTPFSRGSCQPRDWTQVSHTTRGFLASWATREALGVRIAEGKSQLSHLGSWNTRWVVLPLGASNESYEIRVNNICFSGLFWGLNDTKHVKNLPQNSV